MKNLAKENLEKALVIAVMNPNYFNRKVFAMFYIEEQEGDLLRVFPVWDMDCPEDARGYINGRQNGLRELHIKDNGTRVLNVKDIWSFVTTLTTVQKTVFKNINLDFHFFKDEHALERLTEKLEMDRMNIGFDGEEEEGSWFTCLRIPRECLPDGIYAYSLRAADSDDSQPASIEEKVYVNHFGDILLDHPLQTPIELEVEDIPRDEEGNIISRP